MFTSLISRIILLIIFLLAVGVSSFTLFHLQRERAHLTEGTRKSAELLLNTVEKSIFHSMRLGNSSEVQAVLELVGGGDGFAGVRIFGTDGLILKSNRPDEIGRLVDKRSFNLYVQQQTEAIRIRPGLRNNAPLPTAEEMATPEIKTMEQYDEDLDDKIPF